jgi:putative transposase
VILAHRIQLDPNNEQRTYFAKACGVARFAYNWALAEWNRLYELGEKTTESELRKRLNSIKQESYPWMLEVTKCAPQLSIMNLGAAFKNFFSGHAKHPQFKKKGQHDSFEVSNDQFSLKDRKIRIPNLGWVRLTETLRFSGKIMGAAISRTADKWYVSIQVEMPDVTPIHDTCESQAVGVDLGVINMATLSDGTVVEGPKPHKALLSRLRHLSRGLSRKQGSKKGDKKSKNFIKAKKKLIKLHARIANIRKDALHKLTTQLTRTYARIGIEDLNVSGMIKNRRLSRSIMDMSFFEFRRQLEYKSKITGSTVVVIDRFYPSTKNCSKCGYKAESLPLSIRKWTCPSCGTEHDRDVNAAINLENMAASSAVSACGGMVQQGRSMKQEHNVIPIYVQV